MGYDRFECFKKSIKELGRLNMFYIKALQSLSTNANLLTQEQIDYLTLYTDSVPYDAHELNKDFVESIQTTAKAKGYNMVIKHDATPIKSGMIALVYEGKLNSQRVVIKVMRRGINERVKRAMKKVKFLVEIISYLPYIRHLQLNDIFAENTEILIAQTNFKNEKNNILQMAENCKYTDYINVPVVYPEFTDNNSFVIVMSYLDGRKISELDNDEKDDYCRLLAKFGMKCLLFNRFYHADLHPGNIVFMKDQNENKQLGILDYGIMGNLTKEEQEYYHKFFISFATNRCNNAAISDNILDGLVEPVSLIKELSAWEHNNLREDIGNIVENILNKSRNFTPEDMFRINKILRKYKLSLSKSFCRIELALAIADSVSNTLSYHTTYLENVKEAVNTMFETSIIDYD
jgi:predicted unusual protein kinase regulating ubiquinone biosynthesis (AarF/ABC1/UbiB family)